MKQYQLDTMTNGWFIGDFVPSAYRTGDVEVGIKRHARSEKYPAHYHSLITEINVLLHGQLHVRGQRIRAGEIFVLEPGEVADPKFYEPCELVVVKIPGLRGDKTLV